jgi:hypothetical protein
MPTLIYKQLSTVVILNAIILNIIPNIFGVVAVMYMFVKGFVFFLRFFCWILELFWQCDLFFILVLYDWLIGYCSLLFSILLQLQIPWYLEFILVLLWIAIIFLCTASLSLQKMHINIHFPWKYFQVKRISYKSIFMYCWNSSGLVNSWHTARWTLSNNQLINQL